MKRWSRLPLQPIDSGRHRPPPLLHPARDIHMCTVSCRHAPSRQWPAYWRPRTRRQPLAATQPLMKEAHRRPCPPLVWIICFFVRGRKPIQNKSCVFFPKMFSRQLVFCIFGCPDEIAIKRNEPPFFQCNECVKEKNALFVQYVQ